MRYIVFFSSGCFQSHNFLIGHDVPKQLANLPTHTILSTHKFRTAPKFYSTNSINRWLFVVILIGSLFYFSLEREPWYTFEERNFFSLTKISNPGPSSPGNIWCTYAGDTNPGLSSPGTRWWTYTGDTNPGLPGTRWWTYTGNTNLGLSSPGKICRTYTGDTNSGPSSSGNRWWTYTGDTNPALPGTRWLTHTGNTNLGLSSPGNNWWTYTGDTNPGLSSPGNRWWTYTGVTNPGLSSPGNHWWTYSGTICVARQAWFMILDHRRDSLSTSVLIK